ncbi:hypothetical protein BDZ97DRAFT_1648454 [Flammula alnicola]|nr:hypothetical protein BDZ97DRAFT_1648454 [Flammula alnicola]
MFIYDPNVNLCVDNTTASKEWVIQPKPKPGRKPKKDVATVKDGAEVDLKGRRIQNRAAQRAFRERKQSQLSELQARIQSYEQGEIERNVALQNIAKRLKEENEKLRQENLDLQAKLAQIHVQSEQPHNQNLVQAVDKKRWRDDSPPSALTLQPPSNKKSRTNLDLDHPQLPALSATHLPSPSSMVSTPDSNDTADGHFSPHPYNAQSDLDRATFDNFNHLSSNAKAGDDVSPSFPPLGCGFCDGSSICLCHEIAVQDVVDRSIDSPDFKGNNFSNEQLLGAQDENTLQTSVETSPPSILDNLPAYQPPVPLRRRSGGTLVNSVFPVATIRESSSMMDATCSGDPSNCLACGDDAFGKAFCSAIGNTSSTRDACNSCPSQSGSGSTSGCCGSGASCGSCPPTSSSANASALPRHSDAPSEFIPTNDAWQKLKAHPNIEFADLSLLAEVVASRSRCQGPQLVITSAAPIQQDSNSTSGQFTGGQSFGNPRRASPPPRLVPQEVLLECGRRTMRHVHADGVREALRLLDAKFS